MSKFDKLEINNEILKWARIRARLSLSDVSKKLNKKPELIELWESGDEYPVYNIVEKLSNLYKLPMAVFLFPDPPEEDDILKLFRTLPEFEINKISSDTMHALRVAKSMQISLYELSDNKNKSTKKIFKDLNFTSTTSISSALKTVREFLGISVQEQINWPIVNMEALKKWRRAIEESGIYVFRRPFKQGDISGFCLFDTEFPVIYLNSNTPKTRQIFTLFHELCHLLFKINGITKLDNSFIDALGSSEKKIETFCNKFAGEFLVPPAYFQKEIKGVSNVDDDLVFALADKYKVSREVILRKFLDKGMISDNYYNNKIDEWWKQYIKYKKKKKNGGDYYRNQVSYLGEGYLNLAFGSYYQGKCNLIQLADYLNIKASSVAGIEQKMSINNNL